MTRPGITPQEPRRHRRQSPAAGLASILGPVLAGAALLGYAVATGLSLRSAALASAGVLVTQVLPGALCWRAVRPRQGWLLEDLTMGFAIGSVLAMGAQVAAGLLRLPALSAVLPLAVGASLVALPPTRARIVSARSRPLPWWWGPAVGVAALAVLPQLVSYFARHRLVWPPGAWVPHIDVYLHQALAAQLLHRGPTSWPTVAGEDLGYHWFAHAWIAQLSAVSGVGLDEIIMRFMPAVLPLAVALASGIAATRLSGRAVAGPIAATLTMAGGILNVFGLFSPGYPVEPYSPTLALGAPTLVALVVVLALRWRGETLRGAFVLVPVLAVAAAGTKGSTSPLVVAGLGVALVAMLLWNRARALAVLVDLLVVAGALVLTIVVVFHGSSAGLSLGLEEAAAQTLVGRWLGGVPTGGLQALAIVTTVLFLGARSAALFALPFSRRQRSDPLTWVLVGAVLAGLGGVAVFSHPGQSQFYFALTAIPLMGIGSALGLVRLGESFGRHTLVPLALVGAAAGIALVHLPVFVEGTLRPEDYGQARRMLTLGALVLAAGGVLGLLLARGLRRWASALAAVGLAATAGGIAAFVDASAQPIATSWGPAPITFGTATTQRQIDAARWIRDHSDIDDLVMTNRHCVTPDQDPLGRCDSRRWVVTGFSERQSLVEGWTATPRATRLAPEGTDSITVPYWKPEVLRLNDGFIASPTAAAAERLWDLGVRWVYVDHTRPYARSLEPYAEHRYGNEDAEVYELLPPR